jgi:hypothetical protein
MDLLLSAPRSSAIPTFPIRSLSGYALYLKLDGVPFPGLPKQLSTTRLVILTFHDIPHSGYISPKAMATFFSLLSCSNAFGFDSHPIDPALAGEADISLQKTMLSSRFSPPLNSKVSASIWMVLSPASMPLDLTAREKPRELISTPQFSYTESQTGFFRPCFRLLSVVETLYFYKDSVWQSGRQDDIE